jgi:hypothetical protein
VNATGIDLTRLTDHQLRRLRDGWQRVFGRYYTMDKTVRAAITEIEAELERRNEAKFSKR